jgi:Ca2+-binding EF-hand superfamily protein
LDQIELEYVRAGRGFINKAQLGELMDTLGIDATAEEVDLMLSEIDLGKKCELLMHSGF